MNKLFITSTWGSTKLWYTHTQFFYFECASCFRQHYEQ